MAETSAFKMIKVAGESTDSFEGAVRAALETSGDTIRGHSWMQVTDIRANLNPDASIDRWQVEVEIGFRVEKQ